MGVRSLRRVSKVGGSGKPAPQRSIPRVSTTPFRSSPFAWNRRVRRPSRDAAAATLALTPSGMTQASSHQKLRPEILAIGRSCMDRYDQALKQLAE